MKLKQVIDATSYGMQTGSVNWNSPSGPVGTDFASVYYGIQPQGNDHPPSLKNPIKTKVPTAQDGWKKGAKKADRKQAQQDMAEIHKRLRRQIGKPEIAEGAIFPVFPSSQHKI